MRRDRDSVVQITEEDLNIASVKSMMSKVRRHIDNLLVNIDKLSNDVRMAITAKNRASALRLLKSRKMQQALLERRSEMLSVIEGAYVKIEQAADQIEFVDAMHTSTHVLKKLHSEVGGLDKVESAIGDLNEQMVKIDDVNASMEEAAGLQHTIDEGEIDEELEALEKEYRTANGEAVERENLPRREEPPTSQSTEKPVEGDVAIPSSSATDEGADSCAMALSQLSVEPGVSNDSRDTKAKASGEGPTAIPS